MARTALLAGEIRSCFGMTEPDVASSDATNICTSARLDGEEWVINGEKHWTSGAGDPRCKIMICMVKTDPEAPKHLQQSQILVPLDTPGVNIVRPLKGFQYAGCTARPYAGQTRGRESAQGQHHSRAWTRFRNIAGTSWTGAHPPLYALHRLSGKSA